MLGTNAGILIDRVICPLEGEPPIGKTRGRDTFPAHLAN